MTEIGNNSIADDVFHALTQVMLKSGKIPPRLGLESLHMPFDDFDLDSMDKLDFVMALEDALGKIFDANKIVQCKTLADIVKLAEQ
jgi:hypothetical protein